MSELREPLLPAGSDLPASAHYPGPVFRYEPSGMFPVRPGFLDTMEEAESCTSVMQLNSAVKSATSCYRGIAFGLENGTVGLIEPSWDIRELGYHTQSAKLLISQGNLLATGSSDGTAKLWNLDTFEQSQVRSVHTSSIGAVAVTPEGRFMLSASEEGKLQRTSVLYGSESSLHGLSSPARCIVTTTAGDTVVAGTESGEVKVWRTSEDNCLYALSGHSQKITCIALTPNDAFAVTGSADSSLKVWNLAQRCEVATLSRHLQAVLCCAVTPDGTRIISGSEDSQIRVWNFASKLNDIVFTGHQAPVNHVYVTPDSNYLISASVDVIVCSLADPQELICLRGHSFPISSVFLTPDYRYIVSTSLDGTVRIWGKPSDHEPTIQKPVASYPSIAPSAPIEYPEVSPLIPGNVTVPLLQPEHSSKRNSFERKRGEPILAQGAESPQGLWWGYKCSAIAVLIVLVLCYFIIATD